VRELKRRNEAARPEEIVELLSLHSQTFHPSFPNLDQEFHSSYSTTKTNRCKGKITVNKKEEGLHLGIYLQNLRCVSLFFRCIQSGTMKKKWLKLSVKI
jgi:flagellar motor protein MotB